MRSAVIWRFCRWRVVNARGGLRGKCTVFADRKFDGHVKRTVNRPLPSGAVTEKEARNLFVVLVLLAFLLVPRR